MDDGTKPNATTCKPWEEAALLEPHVGVGGSRGRVAHYSTWLSLLES